jgi:thymidylate kinase
MKTIIQIEGPHGVGKTHLLWQLLETGDVQILRENFVNVVRDNKKELLDFYRLKWIHSWWQNVERWILSDKGRVLLTDRGPFTSVVYSESPLFQSAINTVNITYMYAMRQKYPSVEWRRVLLMRPWIDNYKMTMNRIEAEPFEMIREIRSEALDELSPEWLRRARHWYKSNQRGSDTVVFFRSIEPRENLRDFAYALYKIIPNDITLIVRGEGPNELLEIENFKKPKEGNVKQKKIETKKKKEKVRSAEDK